MWPDWKVAVRPKASSNVERWCGTQSNAWMANIVMYQGFRNCVKCILKRLNSVISDCDLRLLLSFVACILTFQTFDY